MCYGYTYKYNVELYIKIGGILCKFTNVLIVVGLIPNFRMFIIVEIVIIGLSSKKILKEYETPNYLNVNIM